MSATKTSKTVALLERIVSEADASRSALRSASAVRACVLESISIYINNEDVLCIQCGVGTPPPSDEDIYNILLENEILCECCSSAVKVDRTHSPIINHPCPDPPTVWHVSDLQDARTGKWSPRIIIKDDKFMPRA